jgi:hypothetical protein
MSPGLGLLGPFTISEMQAACSTHLLKFMYCGGEKVPLGKCVCEVESVSHQGQNNPSIHPSITTITHHRHHGTANSVTRVTGPCIRPGSLSSLPLSKGQDLSLTFQSRAMKIIPAPRNPRSRSQVGYKYGTNRTPKFLVDQHTSRWCLQDRSPKRPGRRQQHPGSLEVRTEH